MRGPGEDGKLLVEAPMQGYLDRHRDVLRFLPQPALAPGASHIVASFTRSSTGDPLGIDVVDLAEWNVPQFRRCLLVIGLQTLESYKYKKHFSKVGLL
jgi:hypothetical protein